MILLSVQNVTKAFVMNTVLRDVSLTLQVGERMGLVGVNGSGKSTLFRLIAGEMQPDEGSISLMRGTRVGGLTQDADISSDLTVQQELERVFEPVREMERRLRAMEHEMEAAHSDPEAFRQLSNAYTRLMDRFADAEAGLRAAGAQVIVLGCTGEGWPASSRSSPSAWGWAGWSGPWLAAAGPSSASLLTDAMFSPDSSSWAPPSGTSAIMST